LLETIDSHPNAHRIFCLLYNLEPMPLEDTVVDQPWGFYANGGNWLDFTVYDLLARSRIQSGEQVFAVMERIMAEYRENRLYGGAGIDSMDMVSNVWQLFAQGKLDRAKDIYTGRSGFTFVEGEPGKSKGNALEPYLCSGCSIMYGLYRGVLGVHATLEDLHLEPRIPERLADICFSVRLMGKNIQFEYHGYGDRIKKVSVDAVDQTTTSVPWNILRDKSHITVELEKVKE